MMRFHKNRGINLELIGEKSTESEKLVPRIIARRKRSFASAIAFSSRPLEPGETFLFEIIEQDNGWAGHIRCGVTLRNPKDIDLPQYLLPDFAKMGNSWVFALKPSEELPFGDEFNENNDRGQPENDDGNIKPHVTISKCDNICSKLTMRTLRTSSKKSIIPTEVGSRIGIVVTAKGELYFLINGIQFGPCAKDLPIHSGEVFAVVDLYGVTKQIKILRAEGKLYSDKYLHLRYKHYFPYIVV